MQKTPTGSNIFTISEDSDLFNAASLMNKNKIGALMISKNGSEDSLCKSSVLGILTERDLVYALSGGSKNLESKTVRDIMTRKLIFTCPETSNSEAKKIIKFLTSKHGVKKARVQVLDLTQNPADFWKSDKMFDEDVNVVKKKGKDGVITPEIMPQGNKSGGDLRTVNATQIQNIKATSAIALDKYTKFAQKNPALGLLSYDIGKGILGKITKTLGRAATVRGGRAIQVSAGK